MIQAFYFLLIIIPRYLHIHYIICIQYHIIKQFLTLQKTRVHFIIINTTGRIRHSTCAIIIILLFVSFFV